ncbi:MAG: bifunctional acetate--CoA ligase family protein/GNAT family N-acetyltransferase [Planctomycetota bacterium]|jgi:acetyltransferase
MTSPNATPVPVPSSDFLRDAAKPLHTIFAPRTVAVIGSTEKMGSVGRTVTWNLVSNPFGGTVFPVNPKRSSVLGIKAYPSIAEVPEPVDLAVIVTPAPTVPAIMEECVAAGVHGAIVSSAGFRELGPEGAELEQRVLEASRRGGIRVVGPNCLGVMAPITGLNATFASTMARPGNVAFISQSGALCTAILDWSLKENVGFSAFVSMGSMLDVGWGDLIDYLGDDPNTSSILIYMESIGDARAFLSAAREVALNKPIILIKAGRTSEAAKAAVSHTGSLAGSDDVLDAAFRRCGVLRVERIAHLFYMAEVLAKQPTPKGRKLTILTNAGGPAVLATDALIEGGGQLTPLAPETMTRLNELLPPHWSRNNPVDILGDAGPDRYAEALQIAAEDPQSDGMLVILTPQDMTDPAATARQLAECVGTSRKPVLASWMGESQVAGGVDILNRAGIPTFPYPDTAVEAFNYMWTHTRHLVGIYETPTFQAAGKALGQPNRGRAGELLANVRGSGRDVLTESESKELLDAYGISTVPTHIATTTDEAVQAAAAVGFPAVLKLHSETVTHKTDVGGVRLDLKDEQQVRQAYGEIKAAVTERAGSEHFLGVTVQPMVRTEGYELIIGSSVDSQFGPVILFGAGGQLVEVVKDRALALPPLNTTLARRMMERTRIHEALKGVRGREAVDLAGLEHLLSRFSQLVVEQPWIQEIDINPLLVSADGALALDARVVLHPADTPESALPRPAIRPYPLAYVSSERLASGSEVTIRPIRPEDETALVRFHKGLSETSVESRYLQHLPLSQRVKHERLVRVCFIDYDRQMALVAECEDPRTSDLEIVAVARLTTGQDRREAEFAIVVSDRWQGRGVGRLLLARLQEVSALEGIARIRGYIHRDNTRMRQLCQKLGFKTRFRDDLDLVEAEFQCAGAQT